MWVWVRPTLGGVPRFLLPTLTKVCGKQGGNQYSLPGMASFKRNKTCQLAEVSPDKGKISSLSGSWACAEQDQVRTATTTAVLRAYYYCTICQATLFIPKTSPQLSAGRPSFMKHFLVLVSMTLPSWFSFSFGHSYSLLCSSYAHHLNPGTLQSLVPGPLLLSMSILSLSDLIWPHDFR